MRARSPDAMRYATIGAIFAVALACAACNHATKTTTSTTVSGSSQTGPNAAGPTMAATAAATAAATVAASPMHAGPSVAPADGAIVYQTNCSSCHQAAGQGMPGTFPPLAGNPVVNGPAQTAIHIVKDGLSGAIAVKGITYNGQMPAWAGTLTPNDIAAVLTYVRSSWGNTGSAVTAAEVNATH